MGITTLKSVHITSGLLAQLVEHIVHIDGVTGSSPVQTTILEKSELNPDWEWVRISCFYLGNRRVTENFEERGCKRARNPLPYSKVDMGALTRRIKKARKAK